MWIQQLNSEHNDVMNTSSSVDPLPTSQTDQQVVNRSPEAVRRRVIVDLRQRIAAIGPPPSVNSPDFDMADAEQCEDVRRLAELLKLRLASVSPPIDETRVDQRTGLVTVIETRHRDRQVPMYRQSTGGRLVIGRYVYVPAASRHW